MKTMFKRYVERLDVIGGIVGSIAGAVIAGVAYITEQSGTLEIGLAVLTASVIYLLFQNKIAVSARPYFMESKSLTIILNIIFVSAFTASVIIMQSSPHRPLSYFILTAVVISAIAVEIISANENNKGQTGLILLKILLVAFSLRYGLLYESPGFYGVDPWWHGEWIEEWLRSGHIDRYLSDGYYVSYAEFPIMHLNIMAMRLIAQIDPKASLFWGIGIFYIISILFVFLLGQHLVNTKTGMLTALFLSFSLHHIGWGAWLTPTSLGVGISAMMLWLILKNKYSVANTAILISISVVIVLAHTVSAFIMAVTLLLLTVGNNVGIIGGSKEKFSIGFHMVTFFWVAMLSKWMYNFYYPSSSFFDAVFGWFTRAIETDVQYVGTAFKAAAVPTAWLDRMEFMLLISFIVIGILVWLSSKEASNKKLAVITAVFGLSMVTFAFPYFGITSLVPGRWLPFIAVLAAPNVAEGILALSRLPKSEVKKAVSLLLIVFVFALFTLNSYGVNTYTPFYGSEYVKDPYRYAFNQSEMTAVDSILTMHQSPITTDVNYLSLPFYGRTEPGTMQSLSPTTEPMGLVVVRKYIYTHLSIIGGGEANANLLLSTFTGAKYNAVYDNGEVKAYSPH